MHSCITLQFEWEKESDGPLAHPDIAKVDNVVDLSCSGFEKQQLIKKIARF